MRVGIIGSGDVARVLGSGFLKHDHDVMLGSRDPAKLQDWKDANPKGRIGTNTEAAMFADVAVLAVKGAAAVDAVANAGAAHLAGKPVIDATNPIARSGTIPENGVLSFFTSYDDSLLERLQHEYPDVHFVKAFNSVGSGKMVNPSYAEGRPTMFICGNDAKAKEAVTGILDEFGWETADMGKAAAARAIEPLCMLWCIQGFLRNEWTHAFKMLH